MERFGGIDPERRKVEPVRESSKPLNDLRKRTGLPENKLPPISPEGEIIEPSPDEEAESSTYITYGPAGEIIRHDKKGRIIDEEDLNQLPDFDTKI